MTTGRSSSAVCHIGYVICSSSTHGCLAFFVAAIVITALATRLVPAALIALIDRGTKRMFRGLMIATV